MLFFFLAQIWWGLAVWADSPIEDLVLAVGQTRLYPARGSTIHVSDGRTLKVTDKGSTILLLGKKPGTAEVRLGYKRVRVTVLLPELYAIYTQLEILLHDTKGLRLQSYGGKIQIVGKLLRWDDWQKIARLQIQNSAFEFLAVPDPLIADDVGRLLNQKLQGWGLTPMTWNWPARAIIATEAPLALYEKVLRPYGVPVEVSALAVTLEPLVKVTILVTEFRRKYFQKIGIEWPNVAQAQLLPSFVAPGESASPLAVTLQALEQNGFARILASPTLRCRSGKEAEFLAGGEFAIKVATPNRRDVIWKKYGVLLKIQPKANAAGHMSIGLTTEISTIDTSQMVDGVPGLLTNRIDSFFDLPRSQTIALSGLIKKETGAATQGLPGLQHMPILGALFSSQDYLENQTELVVFVTPEVVRPE